MKCEHGHGAGSLDMLLDTMCNTFGGVCFIALMVAIISALRPQVSDGDDVEQMLVDREAARLARQRDELKAALEIQNTFVVSNVAPGKAMSLAELLKGVSSNETAIAKLKAQKREFEDALASLKTDSEYSAREALRLERLLKELEERLGKQRGKQRSVRTPTEREIAGLQNEDFWLRNGRLYLLKNRNQCKCEEIPRDALGKRRWDYTIIRGSGYRVDESFFNGYDWQQIKSSLDSKGYVRIYSDKNSFPQLCELRDALIHFRKMYNWHIYESDVLSFVEGYDGRVQ
ncbi:MAG: hypothetical protein IKO72_08120 [Kiritimatiellae bacterium]|nr:hypothetical protein [Kiritimatiellia bacterium]